MVLLDNCAWHLATKLIHILLACYYINMFMAIHKQSVLGSNWVVLLGPFVSVRSLYALSVFLSIAVLV